MSTGSTAPPQAALAIEQALAAAGAAATVVGQLHAGHGIELRTPEGEAFAPPARGYEHFTGAA